MAALIDGYTLDNPLLIKGHHTKLLPASEEEGELMIWSRSVMMGYLNQPQKTRETTDFAEGWFYTGDLATRNGEYLTITG